jgi:hypothetical protein
MGVGYSMKKTTIRQHAKKTELYKCKECGYTNSLWQGKCFNCNSWDTMELVVKEKASELNRVESEFTTEKDLFLFVWNASNKQCEVTGQTFTYIKVFTPLWYSLFHHILPKGEIKEHSFFHNETDETLKNLEIKYLVLNWKTYSRKKGIMLDKVRELMKK